MAAEESRWTRAEQALARLQQDDTLATPGRAEGLRRLWEATGEVEALFLQELLREMRRTVARSGLLDGGMAEQIFTQQWDTEIARRFAQRREAGIADPLYQQLRKHVEQAYAESDGSVSQERGECRHEDR